MIKQSFSQKPLVFFWLCLCGLATSQLAWADAGFSKVIGTAYSLKTGDMLYREIHTIGADGKHDVEYSEPDGVVFGHKEFDDSVSKITPSFTQVNQRNGEKIQVTRTANDIVIKYQQNKSAKPEEKTIPFEEGMVVDAGFNAFIERYWSALVSGTKMDIQFVVPSRQQVVGFTVNQANCKEGTRKGAQCFSMTASAWWVRLLVDPIVVAYDPANKRLLRYTGRANICDKNGEYQKVDIQYHYL